jgi:hypothetical protein
VQREEDRILIRWAGTENLVWNEWYPLSHGSRVGLEVCSKCGARVDFLILASNVSEQEIAGALADLREWIEGTSACGNHRLPKTAQLRP